jgi:tetratricopeptide (TPR) repeat protein
MSNSAPAYDRAASAQTKKLLYLLLACGALLYARSLPYNFVYDDVIQIVRNPRITAWSYLPSYFTEQLWAGIQSASYYRPLLLLWMRINHFFFGLNPVGWHATSILLHLGASALAFVLARRLLRDDGAALVTAAIFMLHPLQVESVVWPSAANETLAAIFILASYLFFLQGREQPAEMRARFLSWMMFALALLTKETAVIVPVMIACFAVLHPADARRRFVSAMAATAPYAFILAAYLIVRKLVLAQVSPSEFRTDRMTAIYTLPSVAWLYVKHLLAPVDFALVYDTPYLESISTARFWLPLLFLCAVCAVAIWLWKRTRSAAVAVALIWVPVHLAIPLLTLPFFRNVDLTHDRYLYVPLFGFALLLGYAWQHIRRSRLRDAALAAVILLYAIATFHQQQYWSDDLALFARAEQVSPGAYLAKVLDGQELARQKRYAEAVPLLELSVRQQPRALAGLIVLANARCEMGNVQTAEELFARALAMQPQSAETDYMLGLCRLSHGRPLEAIAPLQAAAEHFPSSMEYRLALGSALVQAGRKPDAIQQYRVAESLAPESERPSLRRYIDHLSARN